MAFSYTREIRSPDGTILTEVFNHQHNINFYTIEGPGIFGEYQEHLRFSMVDTNSMPDWWSPPEQPATIADKLASKEKPAPVTRDVVTFCTYMNDGRLQLQMSPTGKPIGNPGMLSINGGLMESDDELAELLREGREELGVDITDFFTFIGTVYDPDNGRCNRVYYVKGYDAMLAVRHTHIGAILALINPKGIGRAFVWKEDLEAIRTAKAITPISERILAAFPELMPLPQPESAKVD
jgi:8-oxo-dGTP pyrophosphatase MutT (NUDIX family)